MQILDDLILKIDTLWYNLIYMLAAHLTVIGAALAHIH